MNTGKFIQRYLRIEYYRSVTIVFRSSIIRVLVLDESRTAQELNEHLNEK